VFHALREVQIPLVAAMLLGACAAKFGRALRTGSMDDGLGPTALFSVRLRRPLALLMCGVECGLGLGLILTAGPLGAGPPATCVRLGAGLLFLVATSALIELRTEKPDAACGCFGDFSTAPVSGRTIVRSAFLALAALSTIDLRPVTAPRSGGGALLLLAILVLEIALIGALSPELGEGLIRLGYSEPCELRKVPAGRTLALLRRSRPWRRYSGLVIADEPADMWRELCWRYVVYPARYEGRDSELVFAIYLRQRRPAVHAALVDATTGLRVELPSAPSGTEGTAGPGWPGRNQPGRPARRLAARLTASYGASATADGRPAMPFSSDI
jgi:Methylamine utilisation protein MauE